MYKMTLLGGGQKWRQEYVSYQISRLTQNLIPNVEQSKDGQEVAESKEEEDR